jgi:hypothetical protein
MAYPVGASAGAMYPGGAGGALPNPAYSGTFIPEIWSGKLIEKFYDTTVLAAIANTDYEGEIRNQGDKVKIRTKPTLTINDYVAGQTLAYQRPSSNIVELTIDKGKYFNAIVDDVQETQADVDMLTMWADDASEQMKIAIDTMVLNDITGIGASAGLNAANKGVSAGRISTSVNLGTPAAPLTLVARSPGAGQTEIIDLIVGLGLVLDEQNIPETGRWLLLPAWAGALIKRSELRDAALTGDTVTMMRNGRLGMVDRFTLYISNLLPINATASGTAIYAGHSHGFTFATQLTKMETLRAESTFGTIMRGLQVFGSKVVDGTAIAKAYALRG